MRNKNLSLTSNREMIPFESAEEAWFWYCLCEQLGENGGHKTEGRIARPCEKSDIYIAVKKLLSQGKLRPSHIKVLSKYGFCQVPPHAHFGDSLRICDLWKEALHFLEILLKKKGIVVT